MKMPYYENVEISSLKEAIIPFLKGGNYGKKGYYNDESERIKEIVYNI